LISSPIASKNSPLLLCYNGPIEEVDTQINTASKFNDCKQEFRCDSISNVLSSNDKSNSKIVLPCCHNINPAGKEEPADFFREMKVMRLPEKSPDDAEYADSDGSDFSVSLFGTSCDMPMEGNGETRVLESQVPSDNCNINYVRRGKVVVVCAATMYFIVLIILLRLSFFISSRA
jgi:hypothetical protein